MGRDVTLTIRVKDGEVKQAEQSLNRLDKAAKNVGSGSNSFGGKKPIEDAEQQRRLAAFMGKDLPKAANAAETAIAGVTEASTGAAAGVGVLAAGIAIAVVAFGAAVYITVKLAQEVVNLAKEFADYAIEIGNVAEQTGLATETISALRNEAEATGRDFGQITGAVDNFRKTIGQATAGSEDARAKLNLLGIDGTRSINNIDLAFKQAIATIVKTKDPAEQIRLAFAAFGSDGYKLLPFLRQFNGDVDAAIKKAEELGIVISGKDVDAAREFNRAYDEVKKQIQSIALVFGKEFLPIVRNALKDFGDWVGRNKSTITDWATSTGNFVSGVIKAFKELIQFVNDHPILTRILLGVVTQGQSEGVIAGYKSLEAFGGGGHSPSKLPPQYTIDYSRPQDAKPDPAALAAALEETEKQRKAALEEAKKRAKALADLINDLTNKNKYFGDSSEYTATKLRLEAIGIRDITSGVGLYALQIAAGIDQKKKDAEAEKERTKARLEYQKTLERFQKEITSTEYGSRVDLGAELRDLQQRI